MVQALKNKSNKDISFNGVIDEENKMQDSQSFNSMYNIFQNTDWNYLNNTNTIMQNIQATTLKKN